MTRNKSERKAELLAKAEQMIAELLQWEDKVKQPTFAAIEGEVMKLRRQIHSPIFGRDSKLKIMLILVAVAEIIASVFLFLVFDWRFF